MTLRVPACDISMRFRLLSDGPTHQVLICPSGRLVRPQSEQVMGNRRQDAWEKAAVCEAHARSTQDEMLRMKFLKLRDSWIRIANNAQFVNDVTANAGRLENEENR